MDEMLGVHGVHDVHSCPSGLRKGSAPDELSAFELVADAELAVAEATERGAHGLALGLAGAQLKTESRRAGERRGSLWRRVADGFLGDLRNGHGRNFVVGQRLLASDGGYADSDDEKDEKAEAEAGSRIHG